MATYKQNSVRISTESADRSLTGIAAAWARVGADMALDDGLNVSSITDNGAGLPQYNYGSSMNSISYSFTMTGGSAGSARIVGGRVWSTGNTTGTMANTSGTLIDDENSIEIYGDLA